MRVTKRQLRRIIKEEKRKLLREAPRDRIKIEAGLMEDLDSIATDIEDIASQMYGMGGPGTVSGDAGDGLAQQLEGQVERLTTFYELMVSHFESMNAEYHSARPGPSGERGDIFTREDR